MANIKINKYGIVAHDALLALPEYLGVVHVQEDPANPGFPALYVRELETAPTLVDYHCGWFLEDVAFDPAKFPVTWSCMLGGVPVFVYAIQHVIGDRP